jgi:hypothetical protein
MLDGKIDTDTLEVLEELDPFAKKPLGKTTNAKKSTKTPRKKSASKATKPRKKKK